MRVKRAHLDSNGRRWRIGEVVGDGEHPDVEDRPYLFETEAPKAPAAKSAKSGAKSKAKSKARKAT